MKEAVGLRVESSVNPSVVFVCTSPVTSRALTYSLKILTLNECSKKLLQ